MVKRGSENSGWLGLRKRRGSKEERKNKKERKKQKEGGENQTNRVKSGARGTLVEGEDDGIPKSTNPGVGQDFKFQHYIRLEL